MKYRVLVWLTLGAALLCGCAQDLPLESTVPAPSEISFPTEPLTEIAFSEWNMEDFRFEATCNVTEDGAYKRYSGEIIDEDIKAQLWEMLCQQEQMPTYQGGSWGSGGGDLVLTNKRTGEQFYAGYGIWYENPDVEGGPTCFVIYGSSCVTARYYPIDYAEDSQVYASERFENLLIEGVKRDGLTTAFS